MFVYEDGSQALFLPGTKEFFTLKRYKNETGKDYKRIVLYLCTNDDLSKNENSENFEDSSDDDIDSYNKFSEHSQKSSRSQILHDEQVAKKFYSH